MYSRSAAPLFPRRRTNVGRRFLVILMVMLLAGAGVASAAWSLLSHRSIQGYSRAGVGEELQLVSPSNLPDWARSALHDQQLGADYQFLATVVDLDRDEQAEILIMPAPPKPDLFIPESPLRVLVHEDGLWRLVESELSCRPRRLGSFVTNGWWDLPCRDAQGRQVLRWNGERYVASR